MTYTEWNIIAETSEFHVSNVKILDYFDQARKNWYQYCKFRGFEAVAVHISADFKKELFNKEKVFICTQLDRIGNTSFTLKQAMTNEQNEDIAFAEVVLATIDTKTRKKLHVPDSVRELLQKESLLEMAGLKSK